MDLLPYTYNDLFSKISDFNMLFFKAAAYSKKPDYTFNAVLVWERSK
jgi:hypothetical protein